MAKKDSITKSQRFYGGVPGKPKMNVAAVIRHRLDPNEYFEFMLRVAKDNNLDHKTRMAAWKELIDRGYGRAPVQVTMSNEKESDAKILPVDLGRLSDKELTDYRKLLLKAIDPDDSAIEAEYTDDDE
jgi:hypothetical protein